MDFKKLLEKEFILLDGAMGTMLQREGLEAGDLPETLGIENPKAIEAIHKKYIDAGSQIVYSNTFGANAYKMKDSGYTVDELIKAAVKNAKNATKGTDALVALDIGPIGKLLEPTGDLKFEEAYEIFKEQVIAGKDADLIVFETMTDLYELKAGVLAAKENSDLPVICTMTFEENLRTFTGCTISSMAITMEGLGVDALGVNCSLGPKELFDIVKELSKWTNLPIIVKPNAGLPNPDTGKYDISTEDFTFYVEKFIQFGVKIFGGCCGTSPEYIKAVYEMLKDKKYVKNPGFKESAVCSNLNTVIIGIPKPIGERLNPTGRKKLKEALINSDMNYVINSAVEQVNAGAVIINTNAGIPEVDEKATLPNMVKAVQSVVDTPVMVDSTIPEVLEAAARVANGCPIINSVNGEDKSLHSILPIVKKYGACVVGLTLDENGIPSKAKDRVAIAEKIMKTALDYGIPKEKVFIDCLALTISSEQETAMETIEAIKTVTGELGLKTVLGVSNISFGLPNRKLINSNYLTMALLNGLNLPIINVNDDAMMGSIDAYNIIANNDKASVNYINKYKETSNTITEKPAKEKSTDIAYAIENGMKEEVKDITFELLKKYDSMEIINKILIPILDKAGEDFDSGEIFLPQLIMSANSAQVAFGVLKEEMQKNSGENINKGTVVLATVKGDVHDIGKNIVKILLENYGYKVIDLGKNVEYQAVVDAVIEHDAKLVGLSALMTSTLVSMDETIKLIRKNNLDCKVVVGGAVLTPAYAKKIGADFYAKDAKDTVETAKLIYG